MRAPGSDEPPADPLSSLTARDAGAMRRAGYAAVDAIVEHLTEMKDRPVTGGGPRAEMEAIFREPLPRAGEPIETLIARFRDEIVPNSLKVGHPRFFAFIPGSPVYAAALADLLAAGANIYAGTWLGSPAAAMIELVVLDWFVEMLSLAAGTQGVLVSGGSVANLTALAVAREEALRSGKLDGGIARAVVYTSDQRHACCDRALRVLGFSSEQLRLVETDGAYRVDVARLREAIRSDRAKGLLPFCVIGHGGTTNTGAVDPLATLARIAGEEGLWFHVDAAYGGFAALTSRGAALLEGCNRADSIALDPHKWLFQTFEAGCVLVRHPGALARTFSHRGEYLREVPIGEEEVSMADRGIQLSRSFRALKIWMTLKAHGADAIACAIDRALDLARLAAVRLEAAGFTIVAPPQLSVVAFRIPGADDAAQLRLVDAVNAGGFAFLSSTVLNEEATLRLCVLSPWTSAEDIERTVDLLRREAFGESR
jgi:glutamate/tyrosine decarboxylase-like PLP-dependent enzyme